MNAPRKLSGMMLAAATVLTLAACSTSAAPTSGSAATSSGGAAALPAALQGQLVNPVLIYPPYGLKNADGTYGGFFPELSQALSSQMGLTVTNQEDSFENMLTGVQSGKYPWMIAADITPDRLKAFDFAYLYDDFATFVGTADGPDLTSDRLSACGYTISALASSTQATTLAAMSTACTAAGKQPINVKEYKDLASSLLGLKSGQDNFIAMYVSSDIKSDSTLKVTGPLIDDNKEGIVAKKGSGVAEAVSAALNQMIADGTYSKIVGTYETTEHFITQSTINPTPTDGQ